MKRITALLLLFALLMFAGCSNTESVLEPGATVLTEGFSKNGKNVTTNTSKEVEEWLSELDY